MSPKLVIVIVLFAAAVGGAITLALMEGGIEYRTIPELTSDSYDGERVKVKAQVLSMQNQFQPTQFTCFDIPAEGQPAPANPHVIQVIYEGDDVPQGMKMGAHVTMEGRFDAKRGAFVATLLQTQCPSRYEGEKLTTADESTDKPAP